jgi:hypothetical protein
MKKRNINTHIVISDFGRDGWEISSQIVGEGNRITYDYSFGDAEITRHDLQSEKAIEYSSYFVIHRDLIFVEEYLEVINETLSKDPNPEDGGNEILIIHGLFNAALIAYFRAFNRGDGTTVRLNPKQVFKDKLYRRYHDRLKILRNEGVAHWGDPTRDFEMNHQPVMIVAKENEQEVGYHIWSEISTPFYGMLAEFGKLVALLQNYIALELQNLERQLLHGPEVLNIRHSEMISKICTQASISQGVALELMKQLINNYNDSGMVIRLVATANHSVQFTLSSKTEKSEGLFLDCRYNNKEWNISANPAVIEVAGY